MPPAVQSLDRLGVELPAWGQHRFVGVRYFDGPLSAQGHFPRGHGLGVRRLALAEALRQRAEQLGVELRFGARLHRWERTPSGWFQALVQAHGTAGRAGESRECLTGKLLVGADGLHSRVRAAAGLKRQTAGPRRFGVRRHINTAPWSDLVEVHWADGVEAYVTPVGPELVGIALLWSERRGVSRGPEPNVFARLITSFPQLVARINDCSYASSMQGAGPFRQKTRRCHGEGVALVGDAAGYVDPLTGEGVSLALSSAQLLVEAVAKGEGLAAYERRYRRLYRRYASMAGLALTLARWPHLRRQAIRLLHRRPALFDRLLAVNAG